LFRAFILPHRTQGMSSGFYVIEIHPGGTIVEPSLMVRIAAGATTMQA
jgi:hypothetical protein